MNNIDYDVVYTPPNTYEYGNKYMTDATIRLEKGVLKAIEYHEEDNKTSIVISVQKKENEKIMKFNFLVDGRIRDMNVEDRVHFMYLENEDKSIEFKAFVFDKAELEARLRRREAEFSAEQKIREKQETQNNVKHSSDKKETVKIEEKPKSDEVIISERSTKWKENIPFLGEDKWFKVGFTNKKCSKEQLNQVFQAINESDISSTLKIGFQNYLASLKDVKYKDIINIEEEYKKFVKKAAQKAMGKSL